MLNPMTQHEPVKKVWFVVNMTERWKKHLIVRGNKPTRVYKILANAAKEANRLCLKYPGQDWAVFECIGYFTIKSA